MELQEPSLAELARVIKAGLCIEASFKRGKGEAGMDEYQVRTWQGWHHHMALSLIAVWFLIGETHRGQQLTPALTLPQVRYGLSVLLLEVFCTPSIDYICRQVYRQLMRNELARFYHHRTRKCIPPRTLGHHERLAVLAGQQLVGLVVADEPLGLRVHLQDAGRAWPWSMFRSDVVGRQVRRRSARTSRHAALSPLSVSRISLGVRPRWPRR